MSHQVIDLVKHKRKKSYFVLLNHKASRYLVIDDHAQLVLVESTQCYKPRSYTLEEASRKIRDDQCTESIEYFLKLSRDHRR